MWECENSYSRAGLLATYSRRERRTSSDNVSENSSVNAFLLFILSYHYFQCEDSRKALVIIGPKSL